MFETGTTFCYLISLTREGDYIFNMQNGGMMGRLLKLAFWILDFSHITFVSMIMINAKR